VDFKVDENLPAAASEILRAAGAAAVSVLGQKLGGSPDADVAAVCKVEGRILVTLDTDFGNILAYPPEEFPGIVNLRTEDQAKPVVLALMRQLVAALKTTAMQNQPWIVEGDRIRVRGHE
jgi:predicted nuclease of predicted toxin-antitoxin system